MTVPEHVLRVPEAIAGMRGHLIVSCQAREGEPMEGPAFMRAMALSVIDGGARGVRIEGLDDIRAVAQVVDVTLIGLWKCGRDGVYITPTVDSARQVAAAGASVVAIDGTGRPRPDGLTLTHTIATLHDDGITVMADVSTVAEGVAAAGAGADIVGSTLSGYTAYSPAQAGPDLQLVQDLAQRIDVPVLAEGRISTPAQARAALDCGAYAVVVGGAITRPTQITSGFASALESAREPAWD